MLSASASRPTFSEVYQEHFDFVYRSVLRLGARVHDAEDLVQAVFMIVLRRLDEYDLGRSMRGWLYGIARNVLSDHQKKHSVKNEVLEGSVGGAVDTAYVDAPDHAGVSALRAALLTLEATMRDALILSDLEEMDMQEVAAVLGLNVNTAYSLVRRGRERVRNALLGTDDAAGGSE